MFLPLGSIGDGLIKGSPLLAVFRGVVHGGVVAGVGGGQVVEDVVIRSKVGTRLVQLAVVVVVRVLKKLTFVIKSLKSIF